NPYGARDENYLVMDWPVGRLPCSVNRIEDWLKALENLTIPYHRTKKSRGKAIAYAKSLTPLWSWIQYLLSLFQSPIHTFSAFGYTAAAWRFASFAVFRQIGNPQSMLISPQLAKKMAPAETAKRRLVRHSKAFATLEEAELRTQTSPVLARTEQVNLPTATAGYFNLHGLADSPEWFGQSDPTENSTNLVATSDHPIALQPGDILLNSNSAIEFVFSEACFGAFTLEKDASCSIALAFLKKGCRAFVGSTSTSYGSNGTPLIAADFLAYEFWKNIRQGLPAGEALRQAKLCMAKELSKTYGYLDGEDQKTLTSFVLYGDPLAQVKSAKPTPKVWRHSKSPSPVLIASCDHAYQHRREEELTPQIEETIKKLVAKHLPGMEFTKVEVLSENQVCSAPCSICLSQKTMSGGALSSEQSNGKQKPSRKIIILSRTEQRQGYSYTQYARFTLDEKGRLIKLSISR
ncbi:MAG: C25 family cysteine peptidase, partial [Anaerolineales bacterium]|nr:C25 family cysteine peptidase [Anaerolineales bacterium]